MKDSPLLRVQHDDIPNKNPNVFCLKKETQVGICVNEGNLSIF